ncbi:hypothetical protein [Rhodococcus sp. CH91]|uniref:hypothetical protein n=1 Tax=Rhodococcus sp. CH91 TaxID=2910256 RepID=UPI001F4B02FB|nr:hypothetical protein [Rhodococcus sp. CH91]
MTSGAADSVETADLVAHAALAVSGVVSLHGGAFGEVATYLPGRRVDGIRLTDRICEVHIVVRIPADLPAVAQAVRARVAPLVTVPVQVTIEDVHVGEREGAQS